MKKILPIVIVIIIILVIFLLSVKTLTNNKLESEVEQKPEPVKIISDYKNAEYIIAGEKIKLENGLSEKSSTIDSVIKIVTRYFGNEIWKDLNGDGHDDVVFLLTQQMGGSGTFFYIVAAIYTERGFIGSEGFFLGDRIAPQTTESGKGEIVIVNYAERKLGESFSTEPSEGKSIWLLLDVKTRQFGEVEQDFGGEAEGDVGRETLWMKAWYWSKAVYSDGREIKPVQPDKFTLTFTTENNFSATTDCNNMSGKYSTVDDSLNLENIMSTKMYCEGSQEAGFVQLLSEVESYRFTSKGELILNLKSDTGTVIFR